MPFKTNIYLHGNFHLAQSESETQQIKLFMPYFYVKFNFSTCSPIAIISALFCIAMKAEIWPLNRWFYQSMFYWFEMNIFNMRCKINLVPNLMFPETPLPNPLFIFTVKKKVTLFACDLRYCIISLSCHIKLLSSASLNPTYNTRPTASRCSAVIIDWLSATSHRLPECSTWDNLSVLYYGRIG